MECLADFLIDGFSIGCEFPVHSFERKGKWLQISTSYWLSLHIHSSGWLLPLNLAQSELKKWEFMSYTKSVHGLTFMRDLNSVAFFLKQTFSGLRWEWSKSLSANSKRIDRKQQQRVQEIQIIFTQQWNNFTWEPHITEIITSRIFERQKYLRKTFEFRKIFEFWKIFDLINCHEWI